MFGVEHSSLSLTEEIQEKLLGVTTSDHLVDYLPEIILEPSCFQNSVIFSYLFLLTMNINVSWITFYVHIF
jgi:hypothetical protein